MKEDNIYQQLSDVQAKLKAPKGQTNSFGNYKYRSAEDILEAVKPILRENGLTMIVSDELINLGDRYYVKASATIFTASGSSTTATGLAREAFDKKGMDDAQITGSASSYARKYALNGLFNIDDTKDADTNEYVNNAKAKLTESPVQTLARAKKAINSKMEELGYAEAQSKMLFIQGVLEKQTISNLDEAEEVMAALENEEQ